jgi:glutaredoxin
MKNQNTKTIGLLVVVILIYITLIAYGLKAKQNIDIASATPVLNDVEQKNMDDFAKCLASKKITMYGADWCVHCKKEKAAFGSSFSYVPYVECPDNMQLCIDKGITSYPTWITEQGTVYEGQQGIETLSGITTCRLKVGVEKKEAEATTTDSDTQ